MLGESEYLRGNPELSFALDLSGDVDERARNKPTADIWVTLGYNLLFRGTKRLHVL